MSGGVDPDTAANGDEPGRMVEQDHGVVRLGKAPSLGAT